MKKIIGALAFAILIVACSNPLDKQFNKDTYEIDITEFKQTLPASDTELLEGYIGFMELGKKDISSYTYKELLQQANDMKQAFEGVDIKANEKPQPVVSNKDYKETGPFIYEYNYNVAARKKSYNTSNLKFNKSYDTLIVRSKDFIGEYVLIETIESTIDRFEGKFIGGGKFDPEKMDYTISIENGVSQFHRTTNGAKWWYVDSKSKGSFEKVLDDSGMVFHRNF